MSLHPVTVHSEMMQRELQPVPLNETIRVLFIDEDESSGARLANFLQRRFKNFIMKQASNDFHDHAQALLEFRQLSETMMIIPQILTNSDEFFGILTEF